MLEKKISISYFNALVDHLDHKDPHSGENYKSIQELKRKLNSRILWDKLRTSVVHNELKDTVDKTQVSELKIPEKCIALMKELMVRLMVEEGNNPNDMIQLVKFNSETSKDKFQFPLIEERKNAAGETIQLTVYFKTDEMRDKVYRNVQALDGVISIKQAGTDAIDITLGGIDKALPVKFFLKNYLPIMQEMGFNPHTEPPAIVCIDLDGTTYGPEREIVPVSENTYGNSSKINQSLVEYLKTGNMVFVNTGGTLERSLVRFLIGILKDENLKPEDRERCISKLLFASNGGSSLARVELTDLGKTIPAAQIPDISKESNMSEINKWVTDLMRPVPIKNYTRDAWAIVTEEQSKKQHRPETHSPLERNLVRAFQHNFRRMSQSVLSDAGDSRTDEIPSRVRRQLADKFKYFGDGFSAGSNDHPVFRYAFDQFGAQSIYCVTDKNASKRNEIIAACTDPKDKQILTALSEKHVPDGPDGKPELHGAYATKQILDSILPTLTDPIKTNPQPVSGSIQHYPWGQSGKDAYIPQLLSVDSNSKPWAELWLGIHPNGPTGIGNETLAKVFSEKEIPWLLKVLAAQEMLSVQVHPNKAQAEAGFEREKNLNLNPAVRNYKDPNPKPEIAIPLTDMWLMGGFLQKDQMVARFKRYDSLYTQFKAPIDTLEKAQTPQEVEAGIKNLYEKVMHLDEGKKLELCAALKSQINKGSYAKDQVEHWFVESQKNYPNDIGAVSLFMLNLIHLTPFTANPAKPAAAGHEKDAMELKPGAAFFTPAGSPHFYLEGVCIEHMANSDNVLRAGFTPKHKDVEELLKVVSYQDERKNSVVEPRITKQTGKITEMVYEKGDNPYFATGVTIHHQSDSVNQQTAAANPKIYLVLDGKVEMTWTDGNKQEFEKGQAFLIPGKSGAEYSIKALKPETRYVSAGTPEK